MRARMAIAVSNTPVRLREVLLRDKPDEMMAASPKGTVPVLIDGDDIIDESLSVMRWALGSSDPEDWLTADGVDLIEECDGAFKHNLDRYKYASRYEDADPIFHRREGMNFITKIEDRLQNNKYLYGPERSLADIAIFPFIRQFRIADEAWFDVAQIPNVLRWLNNLMESDLFSSVMKKYPLWKDTGEELVFPDEFDNPERP